jgi:nucleotide-binding universal stress UspA family protein
MARLATYVHDIEVALCPAWTIVGSGAVLGARLRFISDPDNAINALRRAGMQMSERDASSRRGIRSIFHPSDFSAASEVAFAHALKIALVTHGSLNILHVAEHGRTEWTDFPGVRATLERWGLIPKGSGRGAVADLGITVRKVVESRSDPVEACLEYLERRPTDLIVLAVHQHDQRIRWLGKGVGGPIARGAGEMTLFIPHGMQGFVSRENGSVALTSILVPVAHEPRPQPAVEAAARLIRNLELPSGIVTLLHVGSAGDAPAVRVPEDTSWKWIRSSTAGDPVETILNTASDAAAGLIVMTTGGAHGFLDALRGSTTQQVLRKARCPVASLPVGSLLG